MTPESTTPGVARDAVDPPTPGAQGPRRTALAGRIDGLDLARFLALAGMMCTHLWLYGPDGSEPVLSAAFAGKASALFAVLAGVGIVLTSRRDLARGDARRARLNLLGRGLALIVLGLVLGTFSFFILVILAYYGVMFLLLIPFVGMRSRWLLIAAAAWAVIWPFCSHGLRLLLDADQLPVAAVGLMDLLAPHLLITDLLLTGTYPALTWVVYGLVGMAIGTMIVARVSPTGDGAGADAPGAPTSDARSADASTRGVPALSDSTPVAVTPVASAAPDAPGARLGWFGAWLALAGAAVALIALFVDELLVRFVYVPSLPANEVRVAFEVVREGGNYGATPTDTLWNLLATGPHSGTTFDLLITAGLAAAAIGACLALMPVLGRIGRTVLMPVLGAGAAPLTVYTVHVVIATATWTVHLASGGGAPGSSWWLSSWMLLLGHLVIALLIGALLRLMHQRGPFERFVTASGRLVAAIGRGSDTGRNAGPSAGRNGRSEDQPSPSSRG